MMILEFCLDMGQAQLAENLLEKEIFALWETKSHQTMDFKHLTRANSYKKCLQTCQSHLDILGTMPK